MNYNKKIIFLILIVLSALVFFTKLYIHRQNTTPVSPPTDEINPTPTLWFNKPPNPENVRCTMEVIQCPDGSYVGRVAPSCSFAPCPNNDKYK